MYSCNLIEEDAVLCLVKHGNRNQKKQFNIDFLNLDTELKMK